MEVRLSWGFAASKTFWWGSLNLPLHWRNIKATSTQSFLKKRKKDTTASIMPPKGKGGDKGGATKGKGKGKAEEKEEKGGKVKGAQQINVRHILVLFLG
jgi:hypothetical protein